MVTGPHNKRRNWLFVWRAFMGVLTVFACSGMAVAAPVALKDIHVTPKSAFTRVAFVFEKGLPEPTVTFRRGASLVFLFNGVVNRFSGETGRKGVGVIREIRIEPLGKNLRVRLLLKTPHFDFTKYHRRRPPMIVLSLRAKKGTVIGKQSVSPASSRAASEKNQGGRKKSQPKAGKGVKPARKPGKGGGKAKKLPPKPHPPVAAERKRIPTPPPSEKTVAGPGKVKPLPEIKVRVPVRSKSTLASSKDKEIIALYQKAHEAFEKEAYKKALKGFRQVLKKAPESSQGESSAFYRCLSLARLEQKRGKKTLRVAEAYKAALKKYPAAPWTKQILMELGKQYITLGFFNQARDAFKRLITGYSASPEAETALFMTGKVALLKQAYTDAEKIFRDYLNKYPGGKFARDASYFLGDALYYKGDVEEAITVYKRVLTKWPDTFSQDLKTLENMAHVFEKQGAYDRALALLFSALNIASTGGDAPGILLRIAKIYETQSRFKEALIIYSEIAAVYPKTPQALEGKVRMAELGIAHPGIKYKGFFYGLDPYEFPQKTYDALIKRRDVPAVARRALLGKAMLIFEKSPKKAIPLLMKLIHAYPASTEANSAKSLLNKAYLALLTRYEKGNKPKKCIKLFKQYKKSGIDPDVRILLRAARCYLKRNDIKRAEKLFRGINKAKLPPSFKDGYGLVEAEIFLRKRNFKGAAEKIFSVLRTSPESRFNDQMVAIFKEAVLGLEGAAKKKESIVLLKRVLKTNRADFERMYVVYTGNLIARGDYTSAMDLLTFFKEYHPDSRFKNKALRFLGDASCGKKDGIGALSYYSDALKGIKNKLETADIFYRMGLCYRSMKQDAKAYLKFGLALKAFKGVKSPLAPNAAWVKREARLQRAEILYQQGKIPEATHAYEAFALKAPSGKQKDWALYRLGELYSTQNNSGKAEKMYEALATRGSDPFWKKNSGEFKSTYGWFYRHEKEFRQLKRESKTADGKKK